MNNLDFDWNKPADNILIQRFHTFFEVEPEYQHLITDQAIIETFHNIYQAFEEAEYSVQWFIDLGQRIRNTTVGTERDQLLIEFKNARDIFLLDLPILNLVNDLFQPLYNLLKTKQPRQHLDDVISIKGDVSQQIAFEDYHILYFLTPNLAGLVDTAAAEYELPVEQIKDNMSASEIIEYLQNFSNTQKVVMHNPHYNLFDDLLADEQTRESMEDFSREYHQTIAIMCPNFSIAES